MSVVDNGKGERKVCDLCGQTIEPMIEGSPISVWSNPYHYFETCDLCSPCRNRLPHGLSLLLRNRTHTLSEETQTAIFQALKRTREDGTYRCNFNNEFALFISSPDPELIKAKNPKTMAEAVLEAMRAKRLVYQVFQNGRGLLTSDVEEIINKYFPSGIIEDEEEAGVKVKTRKNHVIINGCPIKKDILHTIFLIASDACEDHIDNEEVREALDCILAASPPEEDSE